MKKNYSLIAHIPNLMKQLFPLRDEQLAQVLPLHYGERIRSEVKRIMKDWELSGVNQSDIMDAGYALIALIDEIIMLSVWPGKKQWSEHLLQVEMYGERLAGVQFFERLTKLLHAPERSISVLTVYHACLALGFKGKYIIGTGDEIDEMQRFLSTVLLHDMGVRDRAGLRL